jgi:hypothetical protein
MNLWTLLLVGVGAIQAIGLFAFFLGLFRAPAGFQDETGFHLGNASGLPLAAQGASETDDGEDTLPPFPFDRAA